MVITEWASITFFHLYYSCLNHHFFAPFLNYKFFRRQRKYILVMQLQLQSSNTPQKCHFWTLLMIFFWKLFVEIPVATSAIQNFPPTYLANNAVCLWTAIQDFYLNGFDQDKRRLPISWRSFRSFMKFYSRNFFMMARVYCNNLECIISIGKKHFTVQNNIASL